MLDIEEILTSLSEKEEENFKNRYKKIFEELRSLTSENIGYNRCLNDVQEMFYKELEKREKGEMKNE